MTSSAKSGWMDAEWKSKLVQIRLPNIPRELVLFNVDQCLFSRLKLTLHVTFVNRRKLPAKFPTGRRSQGKKDCLSWSLIKCGRTMKDHYNLEMSIGTTKEIYPILFSLCSKLESSEQNELLISNSFQH